MRVSNSKSFNIKATILGQFALFIWSVAACGILMLKNIPTFETLAGIFFVGFCTSFILNSYFANWKNILNYPKKLIVIGTIAIVGNDILYVSAFKNAPAAQVDLIVCSWPIITMILSSIKFKEKIKTNYIISCSVASLGIYILLNDKNGGIDININYSTGYIYAFLTALFWSYYVIASKNYKNTTPELFSVYCFVGFIISIYLHINYENFITPTYSQILIILVMGITTHSLAYYSWDFGIKYGNYNMLSIMSYANPIISILLLTLLGFIKLTETVVFSTILIFLAITISGTSKNVIKVK